MCRRRFAVITVLGLLAAAGSLTRPAGATEVGGGLATGMAACSGGSGSVAVGSESFVYRGLVRHVRLSMTGSCDDAPGPRWVNGAAEMSGDGVSCGGRLDSAFNATVVFESEGRYLIGEFTGACVIDGAAATGDFGLHGVVRDGSLTGVLRPTSTGDSLPF